jgi:hypothetical protein
VATRCSIRTDAFVQPDAFEAFFPDLLDGTAVAMSPARVLAAQRETKRYQIHFQTQP